MDLTTFVWLLVAALVAGSWQYAARAKRRRVWAVAKLQAHTRRLLASRTKLLCIHAATRMQAHLRAFLGFCRARDALAATVIQHGWTMYVVTRDLALLAAREWAATIIQSWARSALVVPLVLTGMVGALEQLVWEFYWSVNHWVDNPRGWNRKGGRTRKNALRLLAWYRKYMVDMQRLTRGWLVRAELRRIRPAEGSLLAVARLRVAFCRLNQLLVLDPRTRRPMETKTLYGLIGVTKAKNAAQARKQALKRVDGDARLIHVRNNFYIVGGRIGLDRASLQRCIGPSLTRLYLGGGIKDLIASDVNYPSGSGDESDDMDEDMVQGTVSYARVHGYHSPTLFAMLSERERARVVQLMTYGDDADDTLDSDLSEASEPTDGMASS